MQQLVRQATEKRRALQARVQRTRIQAVQEHRRCVICLHYNSPSEVTLQRVLRKNSMHQRLGLPKRSLDTTVLMWCCSARVHMACVLQSMYSLYGRGNKLQWRCVHCRTHMTDSLDGNVFKIGLREVDPFYSSDDEEIEHYRRFSEPPSTPEHPLEEFELTAERDEDRSDSPAFPRVT